MGRFVIISVVVQSAQASLFGDEIKISAYSVSQLKADYLLFLSTKGINNNSSSYYNGHHSNVRYLVGLNTTNTPKNRFRPQVLISVLSGLIVLWLLTTVVLLI